MSPRATSLARRIAADLDDLRELADDDPDTAHAIRCAIVAAMRAMEPMQSLTELALES